jgi:hypothetical protein
MLSTNILPKLRSREKDLFELPENIVSFYFLFLLSLQGREQDAGTDFKRPQIKSDNCEIMLSSIIQPELFTSCDVPDIKLCATCVCK